MKVWHILILTSRGSRILFSALLFNLVVAAYFLFLRLIEFSREKPTHAKVNLGNVQVVLYPIFNILPPTKYCVRLALGGWQSFDYNMTSRWTVSLGVN